MKDSILVVYASKRGATKEIAEKVAQVLESSGMNVELLPAGQAVNPSPYKAVILGSAVYAGQWLKEAANFLRKNENVLIQKPLWLFSSGPTGHGDPADLLKGWLFPHTLKPLIERLHPRGMSVFHGVLNMEKLNLIEKMILKAIKAEPGDFRNWETVTSWATSISEILKRGTEQVTNIN